jgi:diacylglycerol kinase family enzyme
MHVYIYDNFLKQKKYDSVIKETETRLTDYGIAGKIIRLQNYTDAEAVIAEEVKNGATTIVIVGNDMTFGRVLSRAATSRVVFGFLPVGPENSIANVLGIPTGTDACDVVSRRRKVHLDIGWFNSRYFVSRLHIPPSMIEIVYDEQFRVSTTRGKKMELVVCNLQPFSWKAKRRSDKDIVVHPQDGKLEAFIRPVIGKAIIRDIYEEPSIFPFEEMVVASETPFVVEADGKRSKETKITIKLAKKRIEMIVGKERKF